MLGKLRILTGREVCQILAQHGFVEVRRRGSHTVMQKRTGKTTVTVPVPDHPELRLGTLQSIIRQSGLPRALPHAAGKSVMFLTALGRPLKRTAQGSAR